MYFKESSLVSFFLHRFLKDDFLEGNVSVHTQVHGFCQRIFKFMCPSADSLVTSGSQLNQDQFLSHARVEN